MLGLGRPLRLKQGFDPSRPDIHLGHVVGLRKLRQFQDLGHQVILIVGDWTAQIGDPSGASVTRPMLSAEEVRKNAETYMKQFFKVVDREKTVVKWQSEWFGKFGLADVIKLTSKFTVAQMLAREDFNNRFNAGRPIAVTELLYPLLQAYDSVVIQSDVEFGGVDQKFNCLVGRELQQIVGQTPQQVFLMPLLIGTDGKQKMSKSLDNYIAVDEPPEEMYGKAMSIADSLILDYFELLTDVSIEEISQFRSQMQAGTVNPMLLKKRLAGELVTQFHGQAEAARAEDHFSRTVQKKEIPQEIPVFTASSVQLSGYVDEKRREKFKQFQAGTLEIADKVLITDISRLIADAGLVKSNSDARRMIQQGAVEVDGEKIKMLDDIGAVWHIRDGSVITVGKRRFCRIKIS